MALFPNFFGQAEKVIDPGIWRLSIIEAFILPHLSSTSSALQIGYDNGDWSKAFASRAQLRIADKKNIIENIKNEGSSNISYQQIDNDKLLFFADNSIDFVWSFNYFIELDIDSFRIFLEEIKRILKPEGQAVIHHLQLDQSSCFCSIRETISKLFSSKLAHSTSAQMRPTKPIFLELLHSSGLRLDAQTRSWGKFKQFALKNQQQMISIISKPLEPYLLSNKHPL
ncbi:MAG: class I SAM-dependent methyltransferase [Deltaproteobacteria bacterium]|nr:class I SAM-dependent methyltransferase [Deltaproteobacteria bacterium]